MLLRDVMTRDVEVVNPEATLAEAALKMRDLNVGPVPVCDGRRVQGIITDRDVTVRATAEGRDPNTTKVREVMSPNPVFCYEDQDIHEAARLMQEKQIRRVMVLNREKDLVGIVSLGDLAVESGDDKLSGQTLEDISKPAKPER